MRVVYEIDNDVLKITEAKDDRGLSKKLNRHGSGWALFVSNTILELLEIEPEVDMIKYQIENNILKITKA